MTIPTYPYAGFLVEEAAPIFGMRYGRLDWNAYEAAGPRPAPRSYRAIVLENELLRLTLLPELGGRIYRCELKAVGHNLLYNNPVIKPTRWGPREQGWWLAAGGIEFCLPVEEHGYETAAPWQYEVQRAGDAITVLLWDSLQPDRLRARIGVTLRAGEARFGLSVRLENGRPQAVPVKYWTNAMLAPGGGNRVSEALRFVFPAAQVTVHSTGDATLPAAGQALSWPIYQGRDLSLPAQWKGWLGFFERPRASGQFAGVYDGNADEGMARVCSPDVAAGVKGFGMGPAPYGLAPALWTDDDSSYVELHGGLAPTFDDAYTLPAGASVAWEETWLPLAGLGGLTLAGSSGAGHVAWDAGKSRLSGRVALARPLAGQIEISVGENSLGTFALAGSAGQVVQWDIPAAVEPAYDAAIRMAIREAGGHIETWEGPYRPIRR